MIGVGAAERGACYAVRVGADFHAAQRLRQKQISG